MLRLMVVCIVSQRDVGDSDFCFPLSLTFSLKEVESKKE